MRDPFFLPQVPALREAIRPWAEKYLLGALPMHIHEVVAAALFYTLIHLTGSPLLSRRFFPQHYPTDPAKRINWDSHVVSLVQSVLINAIALWAMWADAETRSGTDWQQRIWGYSGVNAMIQSLAVGYFVWDLLVSLIFFQVFGPGVLAHAVSALAVYALGYKPLLNYYSPVFILYELSTPFLNIHWFCDKLNMTGSKLQLYNGILLLSTFLLCRLVWGTWQSFHVFQDVWLGVYAGPDTVHLATTYKKTLPPGADRDESVMSLFRNAAPIPIWLAVVYMAANICLNGLNWFWFFKMITAVKKRFQPYKEYVGEKPASVANGKATAAENAVQGDGFRKRRTTVEDFVLDNEVLRQGTMT